MLSGTLELNPVPYGCFRIANFGFRYFLAVLWPQKLADLFDHYIIQQWMSKKLEEVDKEGLYFGFMVFGHYPTGYHQDPDV